MQMYLGTLQPDPFILGQFVSLVQIQFNRVEILHAPKYENSLLPVGFP